MLGKTKHPQKLCVLLFWQENVANAGKAEGTVGALAFGAGYLIVPKVAGPLIGVQPGESRCVQVESRY